MTTIKFSGRPIVDENRRATVEFQRIIEAAINAQAALIELQGSADNITDGVIRIISEYRKQEPEYNPDGTIDKITYKDAITDEVVAVDQITYNANGTVEKVEQTDSQNRKRIETFQYDASDFVEFVIPSFEGFG